MLNAVFLTITIFCITFQGVAKKAFSERVVGGTYFFTTLSTVFAMLFFVISALGNMSFDSSMIPYAIGFGVSYVVCLVSSILAIVYGSLSLTTLVMSYSLLVPTLYGLVFLNEPSSKWLVIGLVLLCFSLLLTNKTDGNMKISFKWVIYVLLATLGNGFCSVFQKMQQVKFNGAYKNEFMIVSLFVVVIVSAIMMFVKEKKELSLFVRRGWILCVACGIMNAIVNLLVMVLSNTMAASVLFPVLSAGELVLVYFISKYMYKETLSRAQLAGFVLGIFSVVFLSI